MSGIHLFVPMLHRRDAVGEHTRSLRDRLVGDGVECRIYTETPDPDTVGETHPYDRYGSDARPGDVLVYQMATRSDMADWLRDRPEPVVINYHSITPAEFFVPWNNWIARHQVAATQDLADLAPTAVLGIGVSEFDAEELRRAGCPDVTVIPVANVRLPPAPPDPEALAALRRRPGGPHWLSVGRLAPNKGHEDTIAALFVARSTTAPDARLTIVGSPVEPAYSRALHRYTAALGLTGAVTFASRLTDGELSAHYAAADVLVMLSAHEGFGVPLLEAMSHGVPVVAYASGAVPEVVGAAGVLLDGRGPRRVADEVAALLADGDRRQALVAAGRDRPAALGLDRAASDLVTALKGVAERSGGAPVGAAAAPAPGAPLRPSGPLSN
jgi:glycosyltransferase involved in cell wall biosynthesis